VTRANRPAQLRKPEVVDAMLDSILGYSGRDAIDLAQLTTFPDYAVEEAIRFIDADAFEGGVNIPDLLDGYKTADLQHRHAGGRPTNTFTPRTTLIVFLMHALAGEPMTQVHMAETVANRLTEEQLQRIGLPTNPIDADLVNQRLQLAYSNVCDLMDPYLYPTYPADDTTPINERINRHRKLTAEKRRELKKFHKSIAPRLEENRARLQQFMFDVANNPTRAALPHLDGFTGDLAIDATHIRVGGDHTDREDMTADARSTNLEAGLYVRGGRHNGEKKGLPSMTRVKFGHEVEFVTMTVGDKLLPELIVGVDLHRPGKIRKVGHTLLPRIGTLGLPVGTMSADRAYSSLKPKDFRLILLRLGYDWVFDYKKTQLGSKHFYIANGIRYILVDGSWYLSGMPEYLITCTFDRRRAKSDPKRISKKQLMQNIAAREAYRLTPHGRRDKDGFQRYLLPDPSGYILYDRNNPQVMLEKPKVKTVTIPLSEGIEWYQTHPYLSDAWNKAYAKRSAVERKNSQMKSGHHDLDNPLKRQYRGYTATAIAVALLVAAHNIRALDNWGRELEGIKTNRNTHRLIRTPRRAADKKITGTEKQRDTRRAA
jgi:hypothetical protein